MEISQQAGWFGLEADILFFDQHDRYMREKLNCGKENNILEFPAQIINTILTRKRSLLQ